MARGRLRGKRRELAEVEVQREIDKIETELVEVRAKMRGYLRELAIEVSVGERAKLNKQ